MTDDREQRIDPRYNPEFQRGYEPGAGPSRARVESAPTPSKPMPMPDDAPASAIDAKEHAEQLAEAPGLEPRRRSLNPYFAVLWVVGVGLVAGGLLATIRSTIANFGGVETPRDGFVRTMQVLGNLVGPTLMTVGLLTIAGLVFVAAVRGSGRSR
ncbi:hypothetical protein [Lacisediminihabitans sp.]|uniref:hypothetical protein n=1 Tax=Lacisediminihabitans sp. TaxID=2787631 RepID=UPI00374D6EE5